MQFGSSVRANWHDCKRSLAERRRRIREEGRLRTKIDGSDFEVTVYRVGDRYYGARSNEFGFANYELERVKE